jgi:hypothetical protein
VKKQLHLKHVRFKTRGKQLVLPAIDVLIQKLEGKKFAQLHNPPLPDNGKNLPGGTQCCFLHNIRTRKGKPGVMFDVVSYVSGAAPDQWTPDFTKTNANIISKQLKDAKGNNIEIAHVTRCIALGEVLIVEYNRHGGGVGMISHLLSYLFHYVVKHKPILPTIELLDILTDDLRKAIKDGGGVQSVELKLTDGSSQDEEAWYAMRLTDLRNKIRGSKNVKVRWEGDAGGLDSDSVIALAEEYDGDDAALDNFVINLRKSPSIKNLNRYRASKTIEVQFIASQNSIAVNEVEQGLWDYLDELRTPATNGWRIMDSNGYLSNGAKMKL